MAPEVQQQSHGGSSIAPKAKHQRHGTQGVVPKAWHQKLFNLASCIVALRHWLLIHGHSVNLAIMVKVISLLGHNPLGNGGCSVQTAVWVFGVICVLAYCLVVVRHIA